MYYSYVVVISKLVSVNYRPHTVQPVIAVDLLEYVFTVYGLYSQKLNEEF